MRGCGIHEKGREPWNETVRGFIGVTPSFPDQQVVGKRGGRGGRATLISSAPNTQLWQNSGLRLPLPQAPLQLEQNEKHALHPNLSPNLPSPPSPRAMDKSLFWPYTKKTQYPKRRRLRNRPSVHHTPPPPPPTLTLFTDPGLQHSEGLLQGELGRRLVEPRPPRLRVLEEPRGVDPGRGLTLTLTDCRWTAACWG